MRSWRNQVDAPARGAGGPRGLSRFKSGRAHHAPRGQAPCRCSAAVSASPCQGEGREFESRHLLARGWPQQVTAVPMPWPPPESGQPLACRPSPMARGTAFRARVFGVRIPGTVLMESEPIRDRDRFEGGSASWRWGSCPPLSARGRCAAGAAAGLEPSRRVTPWGSTPPSSSPGTSAFFGNASRTRLQMAG
jgi:hypothetical protein